MKKLTALSLTTGLLCGIWMWISSLLGIPSWAGFAGCTAFFAAGGKVQGFKKALSTTLIGVFWAVMIIQLNSLITIPYTTSISTALITFIMCYQANLNLFSFIPGTFIGSFSTFAAQGNWQLIAPALILGILLGISCELSGDYLFDFLANEQKSAVDMKV